MPEAVDIFQLRVTLIGTTPAVWRTFTVPVDVTLRELHDLLQITMGWYDEHLYSFYLRPARSRARTRQNWKELPAESRTTLESILSLANVELIYEYDFGDSWIHRIKVKKRLTGSEAANVPTCIAGERACPPEDCGGVSGYEQLLEVIGDASHSDHEDMLEWIGEDFDPEAFDRAEINRRLADAWSEDA